MSLKAVAERLLLSTGAAAVARRRLQSGALILMYHNVIPDGAKGGSDVSLHVPRSAFAEQLDHLVRTHDVVSLDEVVRHSQDRRRPVAAITFDDAYRGALTLGMAEVRKRGLTATTFVAPAFLNDGTFWWDAIDWPATIDEGDVFRARALAECAGRDADVRALATTVGYKQIDVPDYARCVGEEELHTIVARGGLTLGAHSWSHPNLAALDQPALTKELRETLEWLRARFPETKPWLAYPYGRSSDTVIAAAREAGYTLALRADGGWLRTPDGADPLALPRLDVPAGLSSDGFALRTAGMFC